MNDETENEPANQESTGLGRRTFLGAAAALATLPAFGAAEANEKITDVNSDYTGASRATVERGAPVWSNLELPEALDEETEISVNGYHYDDPQTSSTVEVKIHQEHLAATVAFDPGRAREFIDELEAAAEFAETGEP